MTKTCKGCKETKPIECFTVAWAGKQTSRKAYCKPCASKRVSDGYWNRGGMAVRKAWHMHTRETKDFPHPSASTTVQTIGCLCGKRASYHRGRNNAWSQGMSVVHLFKDGTFRDEFIRILDGRAFYNGKLYTAKKEAWMA